MSPWNGIRNCLKFWCCVVDVIEVTKWTIEISTSISTFCVSFYPNYLTDGRGRTLLLFLSIELWVTAASVTIMKWCDWSYKVNLKFIQFIVDFVAWSVNCKKCILFIVNQSTMFPFNSGYVRWINLGCFIEQVYVCQSKGEMNVKCIWMTSRGSWFVALEIMLVSIVPQVNLQFNFYLHPWFSISHTVIHRHLYIFLFFFGETPVRV